MPYIYRDCVTGNWTNFIHRLYDCILIFQTPQTWLVQIKSSSRSSECQSRLAGTSLALGRLGHSTLDPLDSTRDPV